MKDQNSMVLVFKTSVTNKRLSEKIRKEIMFYNPVVTCNFDLEDCDNILRIESKTLISETVITHLNDNGFVCEELT